MSDDGPREFVFESGDKITVKDGYRALVRFEKMEVKPIDVLNKLIALDPAKAKVGDIKDLQALARLSLPVVDPVDES